MAFEFNDNNFASVVAENDVAVVDFWAEWCGPCRMVTPIVEELSGVYEGRAVIGKMNVDHNQLVPMNFNVRNIPTILFFKNNEMVHKHVGTISKNKMSEIVDSLLVPADAA